RLVKSLVVMAVFAFMVLPKDAFAQTFGSSLETLRDALSGNSAAIAQLNSDLAGTMPPVTATQFLDIVRITAGGGSTPAAINLINQALAGNVAALNNLQSALGGNSYYYDDDDGGYPTPGPGYGVTNCFDGTYGYSYNFPICQANDL